MRRLASLLSFVCLLAGAGCGDDVGNTPDAGSDAGPACGAPDAFAVGSLTGHASPLTAAAGEVRAGRVTAADLPADPADLATWAAGDYVLANDRVALVVSQPGRYEVYV